MRKSRKSALFLIILLILTGFVAFFYKDFIVKQNELLGATSKNKTNNRIPNQKTGKVKTEEQLKMNKDMIFKQGKTVMERFLLPTGYKRVAIEPNSFGSWLRKYPLKKDGAKVHFYNGEIKEYSVHEAVLDMDTGSRDLQQCADSIIRLKAEFYYKTKEYEKIHFSFTNGFNAKYSKWRAGYGISVRGNKVTWMKKSYANNTYASFRKYLDMVFSFSGTLSLEKELKKVDLKDLRIGDVFIKGGSPGHCVIVVDMAKNEQSGKTIFMIAQGFMPAQEMHIVKNLEKPEYSPWYVVGDEKGFDFGGVYFSNQQLKRFE